MKIWDSVYTCTKDSTKLKPYLSSRGGLEVEQWIDNNLLSISVDRISLEAKSSCVDSLNKKEGSMQSGLVAV